MSVLFKKMNSEAQLPIYAVSCAAGMDLFSAATLVIEAGSRALIDTGIGMSMPEGVYGRIAPRSGLACKYGIQVGAGVIDNDYRGSIKVLLFNAGEEAFQVNRGDRIAQLIFEEYRKLVPQEVEKLDDTERGAAGFGSTGQ